MRSALIGYTGFVGSTLCRKAKFSHYYNRKNIEEIQGKTYDFIICAGAPSAKWKANKNSQDDKKNIERLQNNLKRVKAQNFTLISTIDVYPVPNKVDEETPVDMEKGDAYGRNRYFLEVFIRQNFPNALIIRLPALFGQGLKKNFIYDLLNNHLLEWTHPESEYQFYDMENLWDDINILQTKNEKRVNIAVEPLQARNIAKQCFDIDFDVKPINPAVFYDMRTKFPGILGTKRTRYYMYDKEYTISHIRDFVVREKRK